MNKLSILIVDDDQDFAESLADILKMYDHHVEIAFNGEDAVSLFTSKNFHVAFMDVKLPGKNGVESFMEIKKIKEHARVVMMTGYSMDQLLDQAVENGAWGVVHKPLDMEKVLQMLDDIKPDGILIADDDPEFITGIKEILGSSGYTVFTAKNGKEAVEQIRTNGIDVLILDLRMPVLNGLETYRELRNMGYGLPTIIVTAYAREEATAISCLRSMSVTGVLSKPFNPEELLEILNSISESEST